MTDSEVSFIVMVSILEFINLVFVMIFLSEREYKTKVQFLIALLIPLSQGFVFMRFAAIGVANGWRNLK
jgi:high-affinity K+ transport system ATPase subunit B